MTKTLWPVPSTYTLTFVIPPDAARTLITPESTPPLTSPEDIA